MVGARSRDPDELHAATLSIRWLQPQPDGQHWSSFTPAYNAVVRGGRGTFEHRSRSQRHSWSLSLIAEQDSSTISEEALADPELRNHLIALGLDPRTGKQEGFLTAIAADFRIDGSDNFLDARRGFQVAGHIEQAGRVFGGTFQVPIRRQLTFVTTSLSRTG